MHKHLTETELEHYKNLYEGSLALFTEIKAEKNRIKYTLEQLKPGDYILTTDGRGFKILKINKKTSKVRMYGVISPKFNRHFMTLAERTTTLENVIEAYRVTRAEMALMIAYNRLSIRYGSYVQVIKSIELQKQADIYEQHENEQLDRYVEKYQLKKDCECITHEDPHWIHMQRICIDHNAGILRRAGWLAERSFAIDEKTRLADLAYELSKLESACNLSESK